MPPVVRRGLRPAVAPHSFEWAVPLVGALPPKVMGLSPDQGHSP